MGRVGRVYNLWMIMNKHCKGCKSHYNAGHEKNSPYAKHHNDWCCKFGKTARVAIGECKLKNGKTL